MIQEQYVSYEVAKLLKEKGFNEICHSYYDVRYNKLVISELNLTQDDDSYLAPTQQMAMRWLREEKSIYIKIGFRFSYNADDDVNYFYDIYKHCEKYIVGEHYSDGEFVTYEEACEAAIKYCLENLI